MPILRRHCRAAAIGLAEARLVWMADGTNNTPEISTYTDAEINESLRTRQQIEIQAQYAINAAQYLSKPIGNEENEDDEEVEREAFANRMGSSLALQEVLRDEDAWKEYREERLESIGEKIKEINEEHPDGHQFSDFNTLLQNNNNLVQVPSELLEMTSEKLFDTANADDPAFARLAMATAIEQWLKMEITRPPNTDADGVVAWKRQKNRWMEQIAKVKKENTQWLNLRILQWEQAMLKGLIKDNPTAVDVSVRNITFDASTFIVQTANNNNTDTSPDIGQSKISVGLTNGNKLTGFEDAYKRLEANAEVIKKIEEAAKKAIDAWETAVDAWKKATPTDKISKKRAMDTAWETAQKALAALGMVQGVQYVTNGSITDNAFRDGQVFKRLISTQAALGKSFDVSETIRSTAKRSGIAGTVLGKPESLYIRAVALVGEEVDKQFPNASQRAREFLIFAALQAPHDAAKSVEELIKGITDTEMLVIEAALQSGVYPNPPNGTTPILPAWITKNILDDFPNVENSRKQPLDIAWESFEQNHEMDLGLTLHNLRTAVEAEKINTSSFFGKEGEVKSTEDWLEAWGAIVVFTGDDQGAAKDRFFEDSPQAAAVRDEFLTILTKTRFIESLGRDQSLQSAEHKDLSQWIEKGADAYMDMLNGSPVEMGLAVVMAFFAIRGLFGGGGKIGSAVKWAVLGLGAAKLYENTTGESIFDQVGVTDPTRLVSATTIAVTLNKADRAEENGGYLVQPGSLQEKYLDSSTNRYAIASAMENETMGDLIDWEETHHNNGTDEAEAIAANMPDGLESLQQPKEDTQRAIMGIGFLRVVYELTAGKENQYNADIGRKLFKERAEAIAAASANNGYSNWRDVPLGEVLRSQHTLQDYQNSMDENRTLLDLGQDVLSWAEETFESIKDTTGMKKIEFIAWLQIIKQTYGEQMLETIKDWGISGLEAGQGAWEFIKLKYRGMEVTIHQTLEITKIAVSTPFILAKESAEWVIDTTHTNTPAVLAALKYEWANNLAPEVYDAWGVVSGEAFPEVSSVQENLFASAVDTQGRKTALLNLFGIEASGNINSQDLAIEKIRTAMMHTYGFINTQELADFLEKVAADENVATMIEQINIGKVETDKIDVDGNINTAAQKLTTQDITKALLRGGTLGFMASLMRGLEATTNAAGVGLIHGANILFPADEHISPQALRSYASVGTWLDETSFAMKILSEDNNAQSGGDIVTLDDVFDKHDTQIQEAAERNGEMLLSIRARMKTVVRDMLKVNQQASEQDILAAIFLKDEVKISDTESITLETFFEQYADKVRDTASRKSESIQAIKTEISGILQANIAANQETKEQDLLARITP